MMRRDPLTGLWLPDWFGALMFTGLGSCTGADCGCRKKCKYTWESTYDCDAEEWGDVTLASKECVPIEECEATDWSLDGCNATKVTCEDESCSDDADCPDDVTPPDPPDEAPECPCGGGEQTCPENCDGCPDTVNLVVSGYPGFCGLNTAGTTLTRSGCNWSGGVSYTLACDGSTWRFGAGILIWGDMTNTTNCPIGSYVPRTIGPCNGAGATITVS